VKITFALPAGLAVEWDWNENPMRDGLLRDGFDVHVGTVALPAGPGLGVELDEAAFTRWRVAP